MTSDSKTHEQAQFVVPDFTVKDLLGAIPFVACLFYIRRVLNLCFQCSLFQTIRAAIFNLRVSLFAVTAFVFVMTWQYRIWDFFLLACFYKAAEYADSVVQPDVIELPYPILYGLGRFAVWALYTFASGLVMTGLWVIAHECGHQAFSESKFINNFVGWVLHSA